MKIFLYILKDYYKYVVATISLCLFLFILFDFIHKTTRYFPTHQPTALMIVKMYAFQIPIFFVQTLPIASLLASVTTMVLLSRTNEITAMRAAGVSPLRLSWPLAFGGLSLSITAFLLGEYVLPHAAEKMHYVQQVQIEKGSENELAVNALWARRDSLLVNFSEVDAIENRLVDVRLIHVRNSFRPESIIEAKYAKYLPDTKNWMLQECFLTYFNPNGTLDRVEERIEMVQELPIDPTRLKKERRKSDELSVKELQDNIKIGEKTGGDILAYKVDFHLKFAYPLAAFVVSMIGLQFAFKSERKTETAKGVLLAFTIGISYWFVLNATRAIGRRGDIPPLVAAWIPNIFMLLIIYFMNSRARRD